MHISENGGISSIDLHCPSLAEVILAGKKLCKHKGIPFDDMIVHVTTDYGTHTVVYLEEEDPT